MHGRHLLNAWSSTQAVIALSSAEAEYCSMVEGVSEGVGIQNILMETGREVALQLSTDSSAAKGVASCFGLQKKTMHLAVHLLWHQHAVDKGGVRWYQIPGSGKIEELMARLNLLAVGSPKDRWAFTLWRHREWLTGPRG